MARKKILQDSDGQLWPITRVDCVYTTSGTQLDSYIATELGKKSDSGHTHNYAGSGSAGGTANSAARVDLARVTGSSNSANYVPGANRLVVREYGSDCTNMPSAHYYHIYTGQGSDAKYNTQLAIGMTTEALYFRNRNSETWGSWKKVSVNGHTHDYAASSHTHNYAGSSSVGGAATSANKVNTNLVVKLNSGTTEGTNLFTFNGSAAKTINITPSSIGAAASSHGTHLSLGTTSSTAYRGDYGNTAYTHSQAAHAPSNAQKNSDITKAEIEAKLTGTINSHTHTNIVNQDTRSVNTTPDDVPIGLSVHLKSNGTDGLSDGGTYHSSLFIKGWNDHSGGPYGNIAISANSNLWFRSSSSGTAWNAWKKVSLDGHSHSYIPLSGSTGITGVLRSTSEFQSTSANAFRAIYGGYGFIIRNDGNDSYCLLTNKDDAHGSWNSLRPLRIENSTGNVYIGSYTNFSNNIRMGANNTYLYGTNTAGNAVPLLRLTSANVTDVGNTSGITCLLGNNNPTYYNGSATYTLYHTGNKPSPADIGAAAASHGAHIPTYCNDVGDWNGATYNGWFMGYNKPNAPQSDKWYMGLVIAHNSNYVVQTLYDFTSGGKDVSNMLTWRRVKYNGTWGNWGQIFDFGGGPGNYWNKNVSVGGDGVVEVGKYIDFHLSNGATTDNDGRFTLTSANNLHWNGNLATGGIMESGAYAKIQGTPLSIQSNAPGCGGVWIQI